jgi:hypothetical protein
MFRLSSRDIVWCVTAVSKGQCVNFIHAKNQQMKQCTFNVTLRRVRANHCCCEKVVSITNCECIFLAFIVIFNLIMSKCYFFFCQVSSTQCACAVLICHLWPASLCIIFPHYLVNGTVLEIKVLNIKYLFLFSLQILPETFIILRKI